MPSQLPWESLKAETLRTICRELSGRSGFAKRDDMISFLRHIEDTGMNELPELTPKRKVKADDESGSPSVSKRARRSDPGPGLKTRSMSAPKRLRSSVRVEIKTSKAAARRRYKIARKIKNSNAVDAVADGEEENGTGEVAEGSDADAEGEVAEPIENADNVEAIGGQDDFALDVLVGETAEAGLLISLIAASTDADGISLNGDFDDQGQQDADEDEPEGAHLTNQALDPGAATAGSGDHSLRQAAPQNTA